MTSISEKNRISAMIDALRKIMAGNNSVVMDISPKHDSLDTLAETINELLKKAGKSLPPPAIEKTKPDRSDISEERFRSLLDRMQESYFEVNLKGDIIFFNDRVNQKLDYTEQEMLGMNFRRLLDEENQKKMFKLGLQIFSTGQDVRDFEWQLMRKNSQLMDVESSIGLLRDKKGSPVGFHGVVRDITPRKQVERALRLSEERYRNILDSMEESYYEVDLKGNILFFNDAVVRELNYSPEEIRNTNFRKLTDKQNAKKIFEIFHKVFFTGENVKAFEWEIIKKDGGRMDGESSVALILDEKGQPRGFRGITRDVSQRKQTERHLRLITENIHEFIWTIDFDQHFTYLSPSVFRLTGFTPEEIRKTPLEKFLPPPQDDLILQILTDQLKEANNNPYKHKGPPVILETELIRKDGSRFWAEISAIFNRDETGKLFEILGVTRDISERKNAQDAFRESEKRYRMIVENMNDVICILDFNLHFIYVSTSNLTLTGYTKEEVKEVPLDQLLTPESLNRVSIVLSKELEREQSDAKPDIPVITTIEVELFHKEGKNTWAEVRATFNRDENGKATEILLTARDITGRKKAAEEKAKLEKQLHQAQKMETVGRLAGGVAHDFNNMLNVILGYIDLTKLRLPKNNPVFSDILEIEKAACRSRDLTAQLLAFSRKQVITPQILNLNDLAGETQKTISHLIGEDIDLRFYPAEKLWNIKFDPIQVEQILINLALNARDAMPGGGKLVVETSNINIDKTYGNTHSDITPGDYVLLTISDTGIGIEKDHIPYIFEPFFTTKDVGKGTGLGLSTVYGIVKQNNGFISVYSETGKGSTFQIYLPRSTEAQPVKPVKPASPKLPGSGTILLVEDDEMMLRMVTDMLEALGYRVIAANHPQDALSICGKKVDSIDLVITDVIMPQMSGKKLRDKILMTRPDLKVLFMSGYTSNIIAQHGVLEKDMQFIQKPFSMGTLAKRVRQMITEK